MSKDKSQAIAFIGVGFMGHGIVKNILRGGYGLSILDHPGNRPVDDLVSAGAQLGERAGELAAAADIVFICVTGTPEVESVMLGEDGVLAGLREGSIVVDCSTALPDSTIKLAAAVAEKGGSLIDAPMTRTPKEAEEGRLNVMLGGETSAIEAVIDINEEGEVAAGDEFCELQPDFLGAVAYFRRRDQTNFIVGWDEGCVHGKSRPAVLGVEYQPADGPGEGDFKGSQKPGFFAVVLDDENVAVRGFVKGNRDTRSTCPGRRCVTAQECADNGHNPGDHCNG